MEKEPARQHSVLRKVVELIQGAECGWTFSTLLDKHFTLQPTPCSLGSHDISLSKSCPDIRSFISRSCCCTRVPTKCRYRSDGPRIFTRKRRNTTSCEIFTFTLNFWKKLLRQRYLFFWSKFIRYVFLRLSYFSIFQHRLIVVI